MAKVRPSQQQTPLPDDLRRLIEAIAVTLAREDHAAHQQQGSPAKA